RVVTQVAMALGASVQPLTKMTPRVRRVVTSRAGLVVIPCKKVANEISIKSFPYTDREGTKASCARKLLSPPFSFPAGGCPRVFTKRLLGGREKLTAFFDTPVNTV